jgi:hypothetical protein
MATMMIMATMMVMVMMMAMAVMMTIRQRRLNISLSKFQQLDSVGHSLWSLIRPVLKEAPGGGVIAGSRLSCRVKLIDDAAAVGFRRLIRRATVFYSAGAGGKRAECYVRSIFHFQS